MRSIAGWAALLCIAAGVHAQTPSAPSGPVPVTQAAPPAQGARPAASTAGASPAAARTTAFPLVVKDDRGVAHRFAEPPQRVITLLPSLTETVAALGAGPRLVGIDRFSTWPPEIERLPRLGGLDDARIEAIVALKPDLVLASTSARSLDKLDALGVRVLRLRSESYADVRRTLDMLAQLLGTPDEGARTWDRLQRELDAAAQRVPASLRGRRVYFEIGGGPYAAGTTSFVGETLARLGLVNVVPPELGPFPKLNPEFVVKAQPEVVMGVDREQAAMAARPGWSSMPAVRLDQRCGFPTAQYDMLVRPSPRLGEAAARIADCLARIAR